MIMLNVERSIDSLIHGSIGSNADVSLATDILLVFGSTFGLIGVLELGLNVSSCLKELEYCVHSPLARAIKLDMQHSLVNTVDTFGSLCR